MAASVPNATAASLLGFLHHGPMSGWDLTAMAETVIGDFWSLTQSQVYRELDRMAEIGLVESGDAGARNRRPYTITPAGKEAFAGWIDQPPESEHIRFPLLLTVSFGRHLPPERLRAHVEQHRQVHAERLADYKRQHREAAAADTEADPFALATLEFGLAYEQTVVAWCDSLADRLPG